MLRRAYRWFPYLLVGSLMLALLGLWSASPAQAQDGCEYTLPPRLSVGGEGQVAHVDERPLNLRETPSLYGRQVGSLREGWTFAVQRRAGLRRLRLLVANTIFLS